MSDESNAVAVRPSRGVARRLMREALTWEPSPDRTPLLRSDQVGILPTMTFWLRGDLRPVLVPTYLAGLASAVVLASVLGLSTLAGALLGATLPLLGVGLLERYVRREVARRRTTPLGVPGNR